MPSIDLLLLDSTTILNSNNIPTGKPISLVYFSPDCEHCQEETKGILENIKKLKDVQFYFVTIDSFDRMKVFNKYFKLKNYPNITVGKDINFSMLRNFEIPTTPFTLLYDKHKNLRVMIKGIIPTNQLIDQINKL